MDSKKLTHPQKDSMARLVFVVGGPGTNRSLHCTKLAQGFGFKRVCLEDLLSVELKPSLKNLKAPQAEPSVSDELVVTLIQKAMAKQKSKLWLVEGFPQNINQGIMLENLLGECQMILNFTGSHDVLIGGFMQKASDVSEEKALQQIEEYEAAIDPVLNYYSQFGKLRHIDCFGTIPEVYQKAISALMPKVHFIIGPKCSGKTAINSYLSERANMKHLNFSEITQKIKPYDPVKATLELIKAIRSEGKTQVVVDGFPETQKQLETYVANAGAPQSVLYIDANEDICMKNNDALGANGAIPSPALMQQVKEYNKNIKGVVEICKKLGVLIQLKNSEDIPLKALLEKATECIKSEIILVRAHEKSAEQLEEMIGELVEQGGYMHLDAPMLRKEETARRTKIGKEMLEYTAKGKIVPAECTISMLRNIIYSGTGQAKFVLTGFPEEVSQLQLFESTCSQIAWEFYLHPQDEAPFDNFSAASIETYMHFNHRLTVTPSFSLSFMEKYYGEHLQYILINGAKLSGKTTIGKTIADKFGYTFIDTNGLTEELKKKLATEETPAESVTVTFEQLLEYLADKLLKRPNRRERFVLDLFPLETMEQINALIGTLGAPTHLLDLECPIDYVKGRYKIVNGVDELSEDQVSELDKGFAFYEETKAELLKYKESESVKYNELKTYLTLDKVVQQVETIFAPKLVLLKHGDEGSSVETLLQNLSIKYGYLYLNTTDLIKRNIEEGTKLGKELVQCKKPHELKREYNSTTEIQYGAIHYDYPLVLKMLKETIDKTSTGETYIVINNLLCSHKLEKIEDQLEFRSMDELFMVNKEIGQIYSVVSLTKEEYDKTEDVRKAEFLPPKPVEKVEIKKENTEEEEEGKDPPPEEEEEEGKEKKPVFDPYEYPWTNTEGEPRTLGQLYTKWKGSNNKNVPASEFQSEGPGMEAILDKLMQRVLGPELAGSPSYVQVKLE